MSESPIQCAFGSWELELDTDTNRSRWSDAVYEILGLTPSAPATLSSYVGCVYPGDCARVSIALDAVVREGARCDLEHRIVHPDASLRLVQLRAWRSSDTRTLLAVIEDVTSRAAITDRLSSISAFAAGVAHEVNNPLGYVSANLEQIALGYVPQDPSAARELDTLVRETRHGIQRIHTIVRSLMTFSRIEATHHEPLDVNRMVEVAISIVNSEIRPRARLVRAFGVVSAVDANAARLGVVLVHLLLNAAHAIPIGRPDDHRIAVTTREDAAGRVLIDVSDTGRGIPREVGERVFEAFFTTKPAGGGPGLGLSASRNIVHALGGEIGFESEPGNTVFHVVLPAHASVVAPATTDVVVPIGRRRGHVLIVDDEVTLASSLRRSLAREHEVTVCHDGSEALDRLRAGERFDVILSDLMMPGLTGIELYTRLADLAIEQAERMIFLTGSSTTLAKDFLDRITNPWFEKPCDLDALRAAIRRLVG